MSRRGITPGAFPEDGPNMSRSRAATALDTRLDTRHARYTRDV
jgi:hypothetical protein